MKLMLLQDLNSMFPLNTSKMKNPETFFDLTEEQQRYQNLRKNQTKNLNLLNDDDDTTIEAKMLNSLQQRDDNGANLYSKPKRYSFTKVLIIEI